MGDWHFHLHLHPSKGTQWRFSFNLPKRKKYLSAQEHEDTIPNGTKLSCWKVIDGPNAPQRRHLYQSKGRHWRLPVGDEVDLPECEKCLERLRSEG